MENLLGRVGRLKTKKDRVAETPLFLPVINPVTQEIPAGWMREELGAEAVITNAYIISRRLREEALGKGVHGLLSFDGVIMTDSGGYQILEYGGVETSPEEIAELQEEIGSDIAVPLDVPTGLSEKKKAEETVERTLKNLQATLAFLERRGERRCLWAAPIQGGIHLDLLRSCVWREKEMNFDLFALGSPTPLMEGYRFDKLFRMVYETKSVIGFGKPLHLFGAGHPMIFSFIVALGVDIFDSASYYLYAKDERYMTECGTIRVDKLKYLPCYCPVCSKMDISELKELEKGERVKLLAMHNLYVCFEEIKRIKQAIREGRLMELLEIRARCHPSLYQGFVEIMKNEKILRMMEEHTPISSRRGINLYDELSLRRPEIRMGRRKLLENCFMGGRNSEKALLLPETLKVSLQKAFKLSGKPDILFYGSPYGLIPLGLRYSYPFSQTNYPKDLLDRCLDKMVEEAVKHFSSARYKKAFIVKARSSRLERFRKRLVERVQELGIEIEELEDLSQLMEDEA